jgi:YidC/Oxa1 family membrane protein insertase
MLKDNRNTILWAFLALSLFILGDNWQHHQGHPSFLFDHGPRPVQGSPVQATTVSAGGTAAGSPPSAATRTDSAQTARANTAASAISNDGETDLPGQEIAVTTDLYSLDFDTKGAGIDRLELLQHRAMLGKKHSLWIMETFYDLLGENDKVAKDQNMVLFEKTPTHTYVARTGLIHGPDHNTVYTQLPGPTRLEDGQQTLDVSFAAERGGLRVVKTYTFKRGSYAISVTHRITNVSDHPIDPTLYLELLRDRSEPVGAMPLYSPYYGAAVYRDADKFQTVSFDEMEKGKEHANSRTATDGWVAMLQHYYVAAWIPPTGVERTYDTKSNGDDGHNFQATAKLPLATLAPGATSVNQSTLFVGPQVQSVLDGVAPGLDLVRNYGWTKILAVPVFGLLRFFESILGNWGWAIVALTVLIKAVFFPLSAASYRSMARMKTVAPRLKVLQERYKDDRAKLNEAMMELYRTEKINPMGGCLPILVQIPVFIALYTVISSSAELRGAPWILWIHDLSAPDYFSILPTIMMASMFVQYKLNPAPPDPVQARMMLIMPLVFGITFFVFPAGLVLYWVVNNLLSIAQQYWITRMMNPDKTKTETPKK